eukprot:403338114
MEDRKKVLQEALAMYRDDPRFLVNRNTNYPIPLVKVQFFGKIVQQLASFEMIQHYINDEDCPIECIYIFPVEVDSVFTHLDIEFTLQDGTQKMMSTKVEYKESAEVKYLNAVSQGDTAVMGKYTETQRDMIKLQIGNFPPHSTAVVTCYFDLKLDIEDVSYCLRLPISYVPRYMGNIQQYIDTGMQFKGQNATTVPFSQTVKQQRKNNIMDIADLPTTNTPPYLWNLHLDICMTAQIKRISSRNHRINIQNVKSPTFGYTAIVTLGDEVRNYVPDKDFILYIKDDNLDTAVAIKTKNEFDETAVQISILPEIRTPSIQDRFYHKLDKLPENEIDQDQSLQYDESEEETIRLDQESNIVMEPKLLEYIILIDRSVSMYGSRIQQAVKALQVFLNSLPMGCYFNVYSFGGTHTKMFDTSQVFNELTLNKAIDDVKKYQANMPGTEIYRPVKEILETKPIHPKFTRHLYLITDGEISDTNKLIDLIKQHRDTTTVHCFGIGDGVSTELVKFCASAGKGHYYFITNPKEIEKKVVDTLRKNFLRYIVVKNLNLLDDKKKLIEKLVVEDNLAHGEKFNIIRLLKPGVNPKFVQVTFLDPNTQEEDTQKIAIDYKDDYKALLTLAAHKSITESVGTKQSDLSVKYQILHHTTAMIVHEKIMEGTPVKMEERKVPLMLSRREGQLITVTIEIVEIKRSFTIKASTEDWVESLKNKIQQQEGVIIADYCLLYKSKELEDLRTLSEQGIHNGCTLDLAKRVIRIIQPQESNIRSNGAEGLSLNYCNTYFDNERLLFEAPSFLIDRKFQNLAGLGEYQTNSAQQSQNQSNVSKILSSQSHDGSWNQGLYQFIKNQKLQRDQTDIKLKGLDESQLLTLVGIKILMETKQGNWLQKVNMGIQYLKQSLQISDAEIQNYLQTVVYEMK